MSTKMYLLGEKSLTGRKCNVTFLKIKEIFIFILDEDFLLYYIYLVILKKNIW